MSLVFYDTEDPSSPLNGVTIDTAQRITELLDRHHNRPPFFCEFLHHNGFKLLVGLGVNGSCAQYSATIGDPPYLMAVSNSEIQENDLEFLIGNVLSPVPGKFRLSRTILEKIIVCFLLTGKRHSDVDWEEV